MTKMLSNCYFFNTTEISKFFPDLMDIRIPFEAVLHQEDGGWCLEIAPKNEIHVDEFNEICRNNNIAKKREVSPDDAEILLKDFAHTKKEECTITYIE